jgi:hypothetical protein
MATTATDPEPGGRCSVQHARSAVKTHEYHPSLIKVNLYIVVIMVVRLQRATLLV